MYAPRRLTLCVMVLFALVVSNGGAPTSLAQPATQTADAPKTASYQMHVRLDPAAKTVSGTARITYHNPSQDSLPEIWLRLYLKAFSSTTTTWVKESGGQLRGDQIDANNLGDISISSLRVADGGSDLLASATLTDTLLRVPLAQPLGAGQALALDVAWTSKLPRVFARTGYGGRDDTFFMVGQWYPKLAVYERGAWDTEPWHGNSEFFNEFGDYDVSITVPQAYVVAGAGVPAGEQAGTDGTKTLRFTSTNVTDFAFAASPDFKTSSAKAGAVEIALYYLPEHASAVAEYLDSAVGSVLSFSQWYGQYPHPRLTIVDVPDNANGAGGMEYPSLVTGEFGGGVPGFVAYVTSHEIGHQWWPMQTATNEGREPWLDEGLTEYSGMRYMADSGGQIGYDSLTISPRAFERASYLFDPNQPATLPAWKYSSGEYSVVYFKTALGLWTLENVVGTDRFRAAMHSYLDAYRYKHPNAADFRRSIEQSLGNQSWFFDRYMPTNSTIDYAAVPIQNDADGSHVIVRRTGRVDAPVEIQITHASGTQELKQWDGSAGSVAYRYPTTDPAVEVVVDPARKLTAELTLDDNFYSARPQLVPALTVGERLMFWLQAVIQTLGLFG